MIFVHDPGTVTVPLSEILLRFEVDVSYDLTWQVVMPNSPGMTDGWTETITHTGELTCSDEVTFNRIAIPFADLEAVGAGSLDFFANQEFIVWRREPLRAKVPVGFTDGGFGATPIGHAAPVIRNVLSWIGNINNADGSQLILSDNPLAAVTGASCPWDDTDYGPGYEPSDEGDHLKLKITAATCTGFNLKVGHRVYNDGVTPDLDTTYQDDPAISFDFDVYADFLRLKRDGGGAAVYPWDYTAVRFSIYTDGVSSGFGGTTPEKTIDVATLKYGGSLDFGGAADESRIDPLANGGSQTIFGGRVLTVPGSATVNEWTHDLTGTVTVS